MFQKGVRDEEGFLRPVKPIAPPPLARAYVVTNSTFAAADRYVIGLMKDMKETLKELRPLGDISVVEMVEITENFNRLLLALQKYRVPYTLPNMGYTDHVIIPYPNLRYIMGHFTQRDETNLKLVPEIRGEEAERRLRIFLRTYNGSWERSLVYGAFHQHNKLLESFVSYGTYEAGMRELGYRLNERAVYEGERPEPRRRIVFGPPEVRPYVKGT